ncbi:OLC1v1019198C1 [Oldenlandia corymbosa var. corymbosa]|uniref:OLC1v1019198C1 n=1 Tax=Oldenlandia corymbosa var. corymbosa TaxID=529605 RepID=A0AAV1EDH6_OLDCO|nr:OLC1v1019198C1 [Oldenlandia corymbosa var. corymbosa]
MGEEKVAVAPPSTPGAVGGGGGEINVAQPMGAPPPTALAPGFRFHPTDEELVRYYLRRKICGKPFRFQAVTEIDVYKSEPWELGRFSSVKSRDLEYFFFSALDKKYESGSRLNRTTGNGYWKTTGKDRLVRHKDQTIGLKKTLVFHGGRAPCGKRTNWVMHEYRLVDEELKRAGVAQDAFVLCRIFHKCNLGPPNADRYAPFLDEEWDDDDDHTTLFIPGAAQMEKSEAPNPRKWLMKEKLEILEPRKWLVQNKRPTQDDQSSSRANGSEDSTTSRQNPTTTRIMNKASGQCDHPSQPPKGIPFICNRVKSKEPAPEPLSLGQTKRPRQDDHSSSHTNGSEDSTTTSQKPTTMMIMNKASGQCGHPIQPPHGIPFICNRVKSKETESLSLGQTKRPRQDDQSSSHPNGSEDSTTASQKPATMMIVNKASGQCGHPSEPPQRIPFICNREKSEEPKPFSLGQNKGPGQDYQSSSHANGSNHSTATGQEPTRMMVMRNKAPGQCDQTSEPPQRIPFICNREKLEEPEPELEPLSLVPHKRPREDDPSSSQTNGSEDSTTTSREPATMMIMNKAPGRCDHPSEPPRGITFICNREKSEEPEPLPLGQHKRPRQDDPSSSQTNGSEDSDTTSSQEPTTMMMTTDNVSSSLLEFPLLESVEPKESQPASTATFDSSSLEKSVPPGFLKFISNLENEIMDVSMEREALKIEVMRGQAMINILQSRIDRLNKDNEDLRRLVRGV